MYFYKEYSPGPGLVELVECFWILKMDLPDGQLIQQCLVPGGRAEIIFSESEFFWFGRNKDCQPEIFNGAVLLGQRTGVNYIGLKGKVRLQGIRFKIGCQSRFGIFPANHFTDQLIPLKSIYDVSEINQLCAKINQPASQSHQVYSTFLMNQLSAASQEWISVQQLMEIVRKKEDEKLSVRELGLVFKWSYKKTERVFLKFTGYTPRTILKLLRFKRLLESERAEGSNLTHKAYAAGFYDQAHFIRECYHYTGEAPSSFYDKPSLITRLLYKIEE